MVAGREKFLSPVRVLLFSISCNVLRNERKKKKKNRVEGGFLLLDDSEHFSFLRESTEREFIYDKLFMMLDICSAVVLIANRRAKKESHLLPLRREEMENMLM